MCSFTFSDSKKIGMETTPEPLLMTCRVAYILIIVSSYMYGSTCLRFNA